MKSTKNNFSFHYIHFKQNKLPFPLGCTTVPQKTPFFWLLIFNATKIEWVFMSLMVFGGFKRLQDIPFKAKIVRLRYLNMWLNKLYKKIRIFLFREVANKVSATLCSILDSQLCWKSGKFQLVRWSHKVALLCSWDPPPTHLAHCMSWKSKA